MRRANASKILVTERVHESDLAVARMERLLRCIDGPAPETVSDRELAGHVEAAGWHRPTRAIRTGVVLDASNPRDIIFNTFIFDEREREAILSRHPALKVLGWQPFTWRGPWNHEGCVCQGAWEMHSLNGCLHACGYCHVLSFLHVQLNLEEIGARIEPFARANPAQQLFKYDNMSDQIMLEPEYGASKILVERFATLDLDPARYLLLYTKSDNVDHLLDLDHRGRTIVNWSLSPHTQSTIIEQGTPPVSGRIEAMARCASAGYHVRARLSPVIPVAGWQDEYRDMIARLFSTVKPDVLSLDVIGFTTPEGLLRCIDPSLLDDEARAIITALERDDKVSPRTWGKHVFPLEYRIQVLDFIYKEIRRHDAGVPVSLCNETPDAWDALAATWTPHMEPDDYACCCGPGSVPGTRWFGGHDHAR